MSYSQVSFAPATKGKFKCFQCRQAVLAKDGVWHTNDAGEVFLCKGCKPIERKTSCFSK